MSMTVVAAKTYVARIIGGASSQEILEMGGEAILRSYQDWQAQKYWRFLLKDTSVVPTITGVTATAASAVINAPSTGAFDAVNIGQTVTISAGTATLAAGTTVSSYTRNTDGTLATITLSNAFGGTTTANATLTLSTHIPIQTGVNDYNLPLDFFAAATARFITNAQKYLTWRAQEYWDRVINDPTIVGVPSEFTTYNPNSERTQTYGETRLKFGGIPH